MEDSDSYAHCSSNLGRYIVLHIMLRSACIAISRRDTRPRSTHHFPVSYRMRAVSMWQSIFVFVVCLCSDEFCNAVQPINIAVVHDALGKDIR